MYKSLELEYFRNISHLHVQGLSTINLIVGRNNSGKTSLLEAVFLLGGGADVRLPATVGQLRGQRVDPWSTDSLWRSLFHQLRPTQKIVLHGHWRNEPCIRELEISANTASLTPIVTTTTLPPQGSDGVGSSSLDGITNLVLHFHTPTGHFQTEAFLNSGSVQLRSATQPMGVNVPTTFLSARAFPNLTRDAQQFSQALRDKLDSNILEAIQLLDPAIQRIEVLYESGGPTIYVDTGLESLIPLPICGEGLGRVFSIAVELLAVRGGVLLIDEIDNGLHHTVMPQFLRLLGHLCRKHQVQVFATTHNEELLFSALEAFAGGGPDQIGLFRIDRRDGQHSVAAYDAEMQEAVREHRFEVRG